MSSRVNKWLYTFWLPALPWEISKLRSPFATSILPRSTLHVPTSAQGWLSPCPEGMPEDAFSGTTSGLAFCRKHDPSCSVEQLVEASVTTVRQNTKALFALGDNTALHIIYLASFSALTTKPSRRELHEADSEEKIKVRACRMQSGIESNC